MVLFEQEGAEGEEFSRFYFGEFLGSFEDVFWPGCLGRICCRN